TRTRLPRSPGRRKRRARSSGTTTHDEVELRGTAPDDSPAAIDRTLILEVNDHDLHRIDKRQGTTLYVTRHPATVGGGIFGLAIRCRRASSTRTARDTGAEHGSKMKENADDSYSTASVE